MGITESEFVIMMTGNIIMTVGISAAILILINWLFNKKKRNLVKDKVVLITGASSGLGEACARVFHKAGAKVIISARRRQELERVRDELVKSNPENKHDPRVLTLDLSDLQSIEGVVEEAITLFGTIDILINNGGMSYRGTAADTSIEVDQQLMTVNYFGQIALTKAVLPTMVAAKCGHILSVSSIQGKIAIPHRSAYAASKHALQAFMDSLRAEVAHTGVKVSVISPGYIRTNLSINALTGTGTKYNQMDATNFSGMSPQYVAKRMLDMIELDQNELTLAVSTHKAVVYLRTLIPSLYFFIMKKRASKEN